MRGFTEDELDILLVIIIAVLVIAAAAGMFPYLGKIFPALMSGMFRVMDLVKNAVPELRYI